MTPPPPIPKKKKSYTGWIILGVSLFLLISIIPTALAFKALVGSGFIGGADNVFGDQHLKTSVALIELHKTRNGSYPASLTELEHIGQWDLIALQSVDYHASDDQMSYYVEVRRGWVGKPDFEIPKEFWKGTGFDPNLEKP